MRTIYIFIFSLFLIISFSCVNDSKVNNDSLDYEEKGINVVSVDNFFCYNVYFTYDFHQTKLPKYITNKDYSGQIIFSVNIKNIKDFKLKIFIIYLENKLDTIKYYSPNDSVSNLVLKFDNYIQEYRDSLRIVINSFSSDTCMYETQYLPIYINSPTDSILNNYLNYFEIQDFLRLIKIFPFFYPPPSELTMPNK